MNQTLAPGLIIAVPHLQDPNFRQTVVLLLEHNEHGAVGMILNRESEIRLEELCRDHDIPFSGDPEKRVRVGGPVQPERGLVLFGEPHTDPEGNQVLDGLSLSASTQTLGNLCNFKDGHFQCYSGYAGWDAGQLERELEEGAWITGQVDPTTVLDLPPDTMWDHVLKDNGIDPSALVPGGSAEA